MYRFTSWAVFFILIFFYVDYNLAETRDQEIVRKIAEVNPRRGRQDRVWPRVVLKENASGRETLISIKVIEKIREDNRARENESHYQFDFIQDRVKWLSFYDFQIDEFVYYFEKNAEFALRSAGEVAILSLDFASAEDSRYFYSRAATFGNIEQGNAFDYTYNSADVVVETFDRNSNRRKGTTASFENGVTLRTKEVNDTTIFHFGTYVNDRANSKVPIVIFPSRKFNVGRQTMGRKVMFYLIDHYDTIFVVSYPSVEAASRVYDAMRGHRYDNDFLSVDEMRKFDRQ